MLAALGALLLSSSLLQEGVIPLQPRTPLPRPVAGALVAAVNQNTTPAGRREGKTLTLALDIVEAALQAEGPHDPVVRAFAFAESGRAPTVPGPLLRGELGTRVRLSVHNRTDSTLVFGGLRRAVPATSDTLTLAPGTTREVTFVLDRVGNWFYWAAPEGSVGMFDGSWLTSQLAGALIVDPVGEVPRSTERIWVITEWFKQDKSGDQFESVLTFNGKAWPYNERLTFRQGDSVRFRIVNASDVEHPLHQHGFYFRIARRGGERVDTVVAPGRQPLQNMHLIPNGGSVDLSFHVATPGNWVFHCHFASHIGDEVSLHGAPDAHYLPGDHPKPPHDMPGGHTMRGLVIGMHVTPAPEYVEPVENDRRIIELLIQRRENHFPGGQPGYGFLVQTDGRVPARDSIQIPGPVLELRRGQPVRINVHNNLEEQSGVHWHGLEIESYPDGVAGFSGLGPKILPPIPAGGTFAAEFTPNRSGTFPYHAHLHEMRQIGSGMYGAIIVGDGPRDLTRDHLIVAGGGGLPFIPKVSVAPLLVNGRRSPGTLRLEAGVTHRLRIVSIQADEVVSFRLGTDLETLRWTPLAQDGAELPPALRTERPALTVMGPGETADFTFRPSRAGRFQLEAWEEFGKERVVLPIEVFVSERPARPAGGSRD